MAAAIAAGGEEGGEEEGDGESAHDGFPVPIIRTRDCGGD
jgi:hypothetical protein